MKEHQKTVVYWYLKGHVAFTNIHTICFDACTMMHMVTLTLFFASCVVILLCTSGLSSLCSTIVILATFNTQFEPMTLQRLPDICKSTQQMQGSLLAFFHLCLVSVYFSGPSLTEMKFYKKLLPIVSVLFRGFSKPHSKQKMNVLKYGYPLQYGHCVRLCV